MSEINRICKICKEIKPIESFALYTGKNSRPGSRAVRCKRCVYEAGRKYQKEYELKNRATLLPKRAEQARLRSWKKNGMPKPKRDPNASHQVCSKCNAEKEIEAFPLSYSKTGHPRRTVCKECTNGRNKKNRADDPELKARQAGLARNRYWKDPVKSREQSRLRTQRWRENNPR